MAAVVVTAAFSRFICKFHAARIRRTVEKPEALKWKTAVCVIGGRNICVLLDSIVLRFVIW